MCVCVFLLFSLEKLLQNKTFYEIVREERDRKRLIEEKKQLEKTGDILAQMYDQDDQDENGGVSRPQTAMPSPSYFQTGVNTKG